MGAAIRVVLEARMPDGLNGGTQQWVIGLASALSALDDGPEQYLFLVDEGHEAWLTPYLGGSCRLLVHPAQEAGAPDAPGAAGGINASRRARATSLPFLRTLTRSFGKPEPVWRSPLDRTIREAGADIVHFTRQLAFETNVPSIYQPWDLQHIHLPEFFSPSGIAHRERAYRAFCAQASLIVVATKWVKEDVARQFGIPPGKIAVVNPGPVTDAYVPPTAPVESEVAARLGLPARYVFYPAQPWGHKNHGRLFEALRLLRDRGVVVPLVCTGHQNAGYATVLRRAEELGVQEQVTFLGFVDTTEIQVVYRRATGLVFPSLYEGWGLPIVEAFAAGLAVACSNVTSLPELVGDAVIVFDPFDPEAIASAVERLWTGDVVRGELVERGRRRADQFDWRQTALRMRALYRRVARQPLGRADLDRIAADPLV